MTISPGRPSSGSEIVQPPPKEKSNLEFVKRLILTTLKLNLETTGLTRAAFAD